jgi:hypothetical protein
MSEFGRSSVSKPRHNLLWKIANLSTLPVWVAMIVAPRAAPTRWLVEHLVPLYAALGVSYTASLLTSAATSRTAPDFSSPEKVSALLQNPDAMLAGWIHYLAFDLFVGRWIWETANEEERPARLALLFTWWAGPMGLALFLARNRLPVRLP